MPLTRRHNGDGSSGHPFPYLTSLALNLAIVLSDPEDPEQENAAQRLAIVSLPIKMQRWVSLSENRFVPLEHVVIYNLDRLFGGMEIEAVHVFRATRNADVERNEEEVCCGPGGFPSISTTSPSWAALNAPHVEGRRRCLRVDSGAKDAREEP
jgi:hypothetical protein